MGRRVAAAPPAGMTAGELERRALAESGHAVLANLRRDKALIAWAAAAGLYVRIDRRSEWGNPFEIGRDGDRAAVIAAYRGYLAARPELAARGARGAGRQGTRLLVPPRPVPRGHSHRGRRGVPLEHHAC